MRGHCFYQVVNNNAGKALPNVTVEVYYSETSKLYDGPIYRDSTGDEVWPNPYVAPQGTIDFYLDQNVLVNLAVSYRNMNQVVKAIPVIDPFSSVFPGGGVPDQVLTKTSTGTVWKDIPPSSGEDTIEVISNAGGIVVLADEGLPISFSGGGVVGLDL